MIRTRHQWSVGEIAYMRICVCDMYVSLFQDNPSPLLVILLLNANVRRSVRPSVVRVELD